LAYTQDLLPFVHDSSSIGHIATLPHPPLDDVIAEAKSSGSHHFHIHILTPMEYAALGISALSVISKELLFRYSLRKGIAANSDAVIANAW
jgi:divalent metal cation (Fe/Co/Zn/Cd) transporter